jgi:hypothetical protein
MQYLENIWDWLIKSKDWLFDGVGMVVGAAIINWIFRYIKTNKQLHEELAAAQSWEKIANQYQITKTEGGAVVYKSNTETEHYICPSCYGLKQIHPLQDKRDYWGMFYCPGCKAEYPIKPKRTNKQKPPESSGSWMGH